MSYDRLIPNQDTLPQGGLGNLIALPLQRIPRLKGNSVFVDKNFHTYPDQWEVLLSIKRITTDSVLSYVKSNTHNRATRNNHGIENAKSISLPNTINTVQISSKADLLSIELKNQIYFDKNQLTPGLHTALLGLVSFHNPDFYQAQANRLSTRNKPRIICCADYEEKRLGLGRGVLDQVKQLLEHHEIPYVLTDLREQTQIDEYAFLGQLRPKQEEAVRCLLKNDCGILYASTAFGKTVIAIKMIQERRVKTLILVDKQTLLYQWKVKLQEFLGLTDSSIGVIGAGQYNPNGKLDIATFQSLIHRKKIDPLIRQYGFVIVDECHHVAAFTYETLLKQSNCRYILGLSATIYRKDGHDPIVRMQCGPVRYQVSAKEALNEHPFIHQVIVRRVPQVFMGNE